MAASEFERYAKNELFDSALYGELSMHAGSVGRREVLARLSEEERAHYEFWRRHAGDTRLTGRDMLMLKLAVIAARLFGIVFTLKLLESREGSTAAEYRGILERGILDEGDAERLRQIIEEEEHHEGYLLSQIDEFALRYLGSVALGIADAVIELMGVLAGFSSLTTSTAAAGVSGLIVGVSASLSMAAASYLQAKQEKLLRPLTSAATTGVAYILTVLALTTPFFFTRGLAQALAASTAAALAILALFSFYSSVVFERRFARDYLENVGVILVVVTVGLLFGEAARRLFGAEKLAV